MAGSITSQLSSVDIDTLLARRAGEGVHKRVLALPFKHLLYGGASKRLGCSGSAQPAPLGAGGLLYILCSRSGSKAY